MRNPQRVVGLVRSRREGKMVMYGLTPDGEALVESVLEAGLSPALERIRG